MNLSPSIAGPEIDFADPTGLNAEIIAGATLTSEHIVAWRRISRDDAYDSPFFTPEFTLAVARSRPNVHVAVLRDRQRIIAFLPHQFATPWHRRLGLAERVGGEMSDYFGLIAAREFRIQELELMRLCRLQALEFTHLDETQARIGLNGERPEVGLRIRMNEGAIAYWKNLQHLDKRLVSDTERRERKLIDTHGPLRFELRAKDTPVELARLITAKRAQYARTDAHDALADSWCETLMYTLAAGQDEPCRGLLSTLFAGDTWVASHFGIRNHHLLHYWFPAYNNDLRAFSPGRLLLKAIIGASDDANITMIDRGAGDQAAKREFANESHQYSRGLWHVPGPRSFFYRASRSLAWRLARS